ncbi:MAG: prepilin-type N-terminal cleavage/methylation domain-containing protein [Acidobacteria bacterium]|nr:prepilin-type N-terminal cleavage/methylation domain-containing protein [Acidobacteriota bacterium]MCG2816999.1 prepilin-type N-terminal cleavage/methylation domain-containing protein [Candidatus Aminicenantes bacterium]MBU1339594.1 prepilin-type N-terminal cleavage/methylation domain-containing protein [Acidobacteriota bacterium]MBU1473362.1 prepilin-type N-terminal cleavage/methylation domain-containing protein [Acidobacteriota bacterium]MBU4330748.1 prepilin-type N-terminal cleavage/methy
MIDFSCRRKGFSITELLVTMAIIAVIAAVALPLAETSVKRGKEIELRRNLRLLRESIDAYKKLADENKFEFDEETYGYPPDLETLVEGVEITEKENDREIVKLIRFLRRVPRDPMTNSTEWGKRSYQDDPDTQSWGGQNVYDVSTRSPGTGLDGTKYTDW